MSIFKEKLPKDIVQYVNKKVIWRVIIFVLLEIAWIAVSALTWQYFAAKTNVFFHISIVILLGIIPFWLSGVPFKLIDKSWMGTVTDVSVKAETGTYIAGGGKAFPYDKNVIYLKVRTDNGEEKCIPAREFGIRSHPGFPVPNEGDITQHLNDYSVGDKVYHFYGLKYNYMVKKNYDMIECVVCGCYNQQVRDHCINCGHSLIKEKTINTLP